MKGTTPADDLACRLLKFEQQLKAYEKLHATELAELWQALNDCKEAVTAIASSDELVNPDESDDSEEDARSPESVAACGHA